MKTTKSRQQSRTGWKRGFQAVKEFPIIGKFFGVFSNLWENSERFFQLERSGKGLLFSTATKWQSLETLFPTIGKHVCAGLLLGAIFVGISGVARGNILTNGTFDTNTDNWYVQDNCSRETWAGESSTAGMALQGWVWNGSGRFEQTMGCTTNTHYYFRIRADRQSNFATGWARMTLCYYVGDTWNTDTIYTSSTLNVSCSTGWTTHEVNGVPSSAAGKVQVKVEFSGAQNSTDPRAFMFDNAMLYDRNATYPVGSVVEEFSYDPDYSNDMNGKDRGGNWSAAWSGSASQFYASDGSFGAMTGYPTPRGNKMKFTPPTDTGWSISRSFSSIKTGNVYVAYMMNYQYSGAGKWFGIELMSNTTSLAFAGEVSSDDEKLGLASFGGSDVVSSFNLNSGASEDYLVIMAYSFTNRALKTIGYYKTASVPSTEPATWDATATVDAGRILQIDGIKVTAGASSGTPGDCYIDEIRVAQSWEQLLDVGSSACVWDGDAGATNMKYSTAYNWDTSYPADGAQISFAGSTSLFPTNDYPEGSQFGSIWFTNSSSSFTLRGNGMHVRNKIENQSLADQTNDMTITFNGDGAAEINPVNDDLTMNGDIYLETNLTMSIWGDGGHTVTFNGKILEGEGFSTGAGVWIRQNSTIVYNDVNTYQGATTIGDGTLQLGVDNAINNQSDVYVTNTFDLNGYDVEVNSIAGNGDITLGDGDLRIAGGLTKTFSGVLSEAGMLIHNGGGTLTLSGANTYSGGTVVSGGVISVSSDGNLGTVPGVAAENIMVGSWASLQFTASMTLNANRGVTIADGHFTVDSGQTVEYAGVISGTGQFNKNGDGRLNLYGISDHTGRTELQNGDLAVGHDRNFGAVPAAYDADNFGVNFVDWETLYITNGFTMNINRGIYLQRNLNFNVADGEELVYDGIISQDGSTRYVAMNGTGALVLGGTNTFSGSLYMNNGTIELGGEDPLDVDGIYCGANSGTDVTYLYAKDGATIDSYVVFRTNTTYTLDTLGMREAGTAVFNHEMVIQEDIIVTNYPGSTLSVFKITHAGDGTVINKRGTGTFILYTNIVGHITNEAGTVQLACDDGWQNWNHLNLHSGSTFDLDGHVGLMACLDGAGDVDLGSGGTLQVAEGWGATLSGIVSGTGNINKYGADEWTMTAVNTYDGKTYIGGGKLVLQRDRSLGADPGVDVSDSVTITNGGVLRADTTFSLDSNRGISLPDTANSAYIEVDSGETLTVGGVISGAGTLVKMGTGVLMPGSSVINTFTGNLYIDAGEFYPRANHPLGAAHVYLGNTGGSDAATLRFGSTTSTRIFDNAITVRSGSSGTKSIISGNTGGNCTFEGKINLQDSVSLTADSGSTVILQGGLDMSASGNNDVTISGANDVTISTAPIEADNGLAQLIHGGSGTLDLAGDNATGVENQMMLDITGGGTVELASKNSLGDDPTGAYPDKINFSGSGGSLYNTSDIDFTTGGNEWGITVASGVDATFNVGDGSTDDLEIPGVISGAGNVVKTGPGNLHLTGVNTFDGPVTVSAGSLRIAADTALGDNSQTLTLNGGTLFAKSSMTVAAARSVVVGASGATFGGAATLTIDLVISEQAV